MLRLKIFILSLISKKQNGFVPGRQILNSAIVVHENIHSLSINKKSSFLLKLDLLKSFDRFNWCFLLRILRAFGFGDNFIQIIEQCVSTPNFSVLINGSASSFFYGSRGIRQGDPLSPFLFILISEALSRIIWREVRNGNIMGL